MSDPLIKFSGVKKSFGKLHVFESLDLEVKRGEVLVVLGESGSGKSVLLKMLIGLVRPDAGEILFDGTNLTELDEEGFEAVRRRIAMLFQGNALFDSMTILDNVAYPLREHSDMEEDEIKKTVTEKLGLVGLEDIENKLPSQLSGGMRKRVALARAIACNPEVLLYDEPTTGLDPPNTRRISELIRKLNEQLNVTSLVITHDMASAYFVADRVALLNDGRISAVMTRDEMVSSDREEIKEFVEAMPRW
jgi:phospholipid/cholesterol/gamma-HCH transport system ATP-binding protein